MNYICRFVTSQPLYILQSAVVAAVFTAIVLLWSMSIPFNGAPDEFTHTFLVEYLYQFGRVPVPGIDPAEPVMSTLTGTWLAKDRFWYFGLPYLHSLGATATAHLLAGFLPTNSGYLAIRAFNWLLAPVFALSLMAVARLVGLRGSLAILVPSAFLLVPQATFLFAYFNADAFALTATTLALALLLWAFQNPRGARPLLFGLACGLILSSKIYFWPALVFFVVLIAYQNFRDTAFPLMRFLMRVLFASALVAVPVLLRTYWQFGEVTGIQGQVLFTKTHLTGQTVPCFVWCSTGIVDYPNISWWLLSAARSFFYGLGWMDVFLPDNVYLFFFYPLVGALLLASLGRSVWSIAAYRSAGLEAFNIPLITVLFWAMTVSVILLNIIGSQMLLPQPQGRYLYVIFPFAVFLVSTLLGKPRTETTTAASSNDKALIA